MLFVAMHNPVTNMNIPKRANMRQSPVRGARVYLRVSTDSQDLARHEAIVANARAPTGPNCYG